MSRQDGIFAMLLAACATPALAAPVAAAEVLPLEHHEAVFTNYQLRSGESFESLRLHYSTAGTPVRDAAGKIKNAILLLHWTSASGAALQSPEYISSLYAPGRPLDVANHYLIFLDNLGHGRSTKPSDGLHAKFPRYGYRDLVALQHRLITETLGIERLYAIVGLSMGGMHAWLWAEEFPEAVAAIMPIVALPSHIAGRNLIWRRIVARAIRTDPEWLGGDYKTPPRGWTEAFPLFRMMLDGVPHLQALAPDKASADAFIDSAAEVARLLDANDVLYSLESSDDYDPEPALDKVRAKVYALNFSDDEFNPPVLGILERLTLRVPAARFVVQPGTVSSHGHLTQAHPALWAPHVAEFLESLK